MNSKEMTTQEKNEIIARWMGWVETNGMTGICPDDGKIGFLPFYTTDANAIGEVVEKIRQSGHAIQINGGETRWTVSIKSLFTVFPLILYGDTEQAAKVSAIVEFIKAKL